MEAVLISMPAAPAEAFHQALRQRETQVLRTAYRILGNWADAEDVAQEVFLRLHKRGVQFESDAALGSWVYRVTVNLCLDGVRARARRPLVELGERQSGGSSPEADLLGDERRQKLMAALATLPNRERAAIVLREIEGLSTAEVAAALGTAEVTVRSQIAKAMTKLKERMKEAFQG